MSFSRHAFQNVGFQVGRDDAAPIWPGRHEPPDLSLLHELRRRASASGYGIVTPDYSASITPVPAVINLIGI